MKTTQEEQIKFSLEIAKASATYLMDNNGAKDLRKPDLLKTEIWKAEDGATHICLKDESGNTCGHYRFIVGSHGKYRMSKIKEDITPRYAGHDPKEEEDPLEPAQIEIGEALQKEFLFGKYHGQFQPFIASVNSAVPPIDLHKISHICRIGDIQYLLYSQRLKHFDLAVKLEEPKGEAGGGIRYWRTMVIPRPIYSVEDARIICNALCVDFGVRKVEERLTYEEARSRYNKTDTSFHIRADGFDLWFEKQDFVIIPKAK